MTLRRRDNMDEAVYAIADCLADISTWMVNILLEINLNIKQNIRFKVSSSYVESAKLVRSLGVISDNTLKMEKQINAIL